MKWTWTLLFALVLTILVVEVTGFFLPARTEAERSADVEASPERVFALLEDLHTWPLWSPLLQKPEGGAITPEYLGEEQGLGAQMLVRFGGRQKVLFTIVEHEPPRRLVLNTRSGTVDEDLLAGEGFEAWDELVLEPLDAGRTRLTWRRSGSELESYWMRFLDRFVVRGRLEEALQRSVDAVAARFAN